MDAHITFDWKKHNKKQFPAANDDNGQFKVNFINIVKCTPDGILKVPLMVYQNHHYDMVYVDIPPFIGLFFTNSELFDENSDFSCRISGATFALVHIFSKLYFCIVFIVRPNRLPNIIYKNK